MSLKAIWSGNTPYSKLLLTVGVILISAFVFTMISTILATGIYGVSMLQLETLLADYRNPDAISILKFIQTVSQIGTFILPAFLIAYLFDQQPIEYLSLGKKVNGVSAVLSVLALLIALPLINYLGEVNSHMSLPSFLSGIENWMRNLENKAAEITTSLLNMNSISDVLFNLFMIALLPAIGEELLFRGIIQRIFSELFKDKHVAVWTTAILFSAMHMQFYGFIPRMMLGVLLGYLLVWSGSLWLPIIAHFVNNAAAVVFTYLFSEELMTIDPDKLGTEGEMTSVLISVIVVTGLLLVIYRVEKARKQTYSSG